MMREIAANLVDWLQDRRKLGEEAARAIVDPLAHHWRHGRILTDVVTLIPQEPDVAVEAEAGSEDSESGEVQASSSKVAKVADRTARYVIVELHRAGGNGCWMGRKREFKSSRHFCSLPDKIEHTHVCRLCWPQGTFDSDDNPSEASPAGSGDEELEDDNAPPAGLGRLRG